MPEFDAGVAGGELPGEAGQLDLGDATLAAVLGGVVDLQSAGEGEGLLGRERLVERGDVVGVEVVHHRGDLVRVGVVDGQQVVDAVGPVDAGPGRFGVGAAPSAQWFGPDEDRASPVAGGRIRSPLGRPAPAWPACQAWRLRATAVASRPSRPPDRPDRKAGRRQPGRLPSPRRTRRWRAAGSSSMLSGEV